MSTEAPAVPATEVPQAPTPATPVPVPAPVPVSIAPEPVAPKAQDPKQESTGDPGLDYALGFVNKAGITEDHPAMQAAFQGDFGLLKAALAEKGVAGWEQAVALGEKAFETFKQTAEAEAKVIGESVVQVAQAVGVEWEDAVAWARDNAKPEEATTINELLQSPATAKMAALWITHNFAQQANVDMPPSKQAVPAAATPQAAGPAAPIDRVTFATEAGKLHKQFGDAYTQRPEYAALARRLQR
jgi:hypothetical protein